MIGLVGYVRKITNEICQDFDVPCFIGEAANVPELARSMEGHFSDGRQGRPAAIPSPTPFIVKAISSPARVCEGGIDVAISIEQEIRATTGPSEFAAVYCCAFSLLGPETLVCQSFDLDQDSEFVFRVHQSP
jgi:hypothetical protein